MLQVGATGINHPPTTHKYMKERAPRYKGMKADTLGTPL
jgi:hypothetical protein